GPSIVGETDDSRCDPVSRVGALRPRSTIHSGPEPREPTGAQRSDRDRRSTPVLIPSAPPVRKSGQRSGVDATLAAHHRGRSHAFDVFVSGSGGGGGGGLRR